VLNKTIITYYQILKIGTKLWIYICLYVTERIRSSLEEHEVPTLRCWITGMLCVIFTFCLVTCYSGLSGLPRYSVWFIYRFCTRNLACISVLRHACPIWRPYQTIQQISVGRGGWCRRWQIFLLCSSQSTKDWDIVVAFPAGARCFFYFPQRLDQLWGPPSHQFVHKRVTFLGNKTVGATIVQRTNGAVSLLPLYAFMASTETTCTIFMQWP
jgi:hypothetical protein